MNQTQELWQTIETLFTKTGVLSSTSTITNFNNDTKHNVMSWSDDTLGQTQQCVERFFFSNWQTKQQNIQSQVSTPCSEDYQFKREALETDSLKFCRTSFFFFKKKKNLVSSSHWPAGHFMNRESFGKTCDDMEQSMRQTMSKTNQLCSPYLKLLTMLSCWKHSKRMQMKPFSGCRFRWRLDRVQVYVRRSIVHVRKPNCCVYFVVMSSKTAGFAWQSRCMVHDKNRADGSDVDVQWYLR